MTADSSAVVAALSSWHGAHHRAGPALREVEHLPAHALTETYSVLTRLPRGRAVSGDIAAGLLRMNFDGLPLTLDAIARSRLPRRLADAGITAGATYDGLVALEAEAHEELLLTLDERAVRTYTALGVPFRLL